MLRIGTGKWKWTAATLILLTAFSLGWAAGASSSSTWRILINGKPSSLPIHVIKNMLFVSLEDLARLPGWKVDIDLGSRKISMDTPSGMEAPVTLQSPKPQKKQASPPIEARSGGSGPPNNVRMTVQAALSAMGAVEGGITNGSLSPIDAHKKLDETKGIVRQAIALLWNLPRTHTIQTDLQVAMEDLESQVSLYTAAGETQQGVLPWTDPTAQSLLLKYPDLRPCHVSKGSVDGLDMECGKNTLSVLENQDVQDVNNDLNSY